MTNPRLNTAIEAALDAYHHIGNLSRPNTNVKFDDIPQRFKDLYTALDELQKEWDQHTTGQPPTPPCGGYVCHCTTTPYVHFHEHDCTCTGETEPPQEDGVVYLDIR